MIISLKRLRRRKNGEDVEEKRDKKWMNNRNKNHTIEIRYVTLFTTPREKQDKIYYEKIIINNE